jgi:hypothetical protein
MKKCTKCNVEQSLSEFYKHKSTIDGLSGQCRTCMKQVSRQWAKNNKKRTLEITRKYQTKNQGIYEWYEDDICLYVGQSVQLNNRMCTHRTLFNNPHLSKKETQSYLYEALRQHQNPQIRIIEECSPEVLLEREQYYIDTKKPLYNTYSI